MSSGGSSQPEYNKVNVDLSGIDEFAQTQTGQGYGDWINKLKTSKIVSHYKNGGLLLQNGDSTPYADVSGLVGDYNNWVQAQAASKKSRSDYLNLSQDMQGRDSTILTGPAATKTLLG